MRLIATLIANPGKADLTQQMAGQAACVAGAGSVSWLAEGLACDLHFASGADAGQVEAALRQELAGNHVDLVVQQEAGRRKRLLLADMDSTIIGQECIDELADMVGLKERVAAITARAMNGEIEFEPALRERVSLLAGLPATVIDELIRTRITLNPGARELTATMKRHGARTVLVSGGFSAFTGPVAQMAGFDEHHGNELLIENGRLAGRVAEPILGRQAKRETLLRISGTLGLEPHEAIAVGDGANDLDMLQLAGMGVAIHAKPAVALAAGARVEHGDLTALLYIQGYRQSEFAG